MSKTSLQFSQLKQHIHKQQMRKGQTHKVRTINTIKWKLLMLQTVDKLKLNTKFDHCLLDDLKTVINKISEEKFIEAIINMQPYKPQFKPISSVPRQANSHKKQTRMFETTLGEDFHDEITTSSSSFAKHSDIQHRMAVKKLKQKYDLFSTFIQDEVFTKEINSHYHPYFKVIDGFTQLLQNRFKVIISKQLQSNTLMTLKELTESLANYMALIENFFKMSSTPIIDIFNPKIDEERTKFEEDIYNFLVIYLRNNQKLCGSLRKILRFYLKHSTEVRKFLDNCPNNADIQKFDISDKLKIEGCYVYSSSQLINFSNLIKGKQCLEQLAQIRKSIYKDIDQYYKESEDDKSIQVSSECQLQIFKFLLTKLKIFAIEIYAGLKLLQVLYGEDEISYHFDEASYVHSQLSIAIEAIEQNL